jgi:hypothetical protein
MVTPGRLELPTRSLGNCCSIHLSYGATRFVDYVASLILLGFARSSFGNCWTFHDPDLARAGGHLSYGATRFVDYVASLVLLGFARSSLGNCWTFHDPALGGPGAT